MPDPAQQRWFYEEHGQRKGPVTFEVIKEIVRDGKLSPQSLIWCSGWPAWKALGDVPEVSNAIARTEQPARKPNTLALRSRNRRPENARATPFPTWAWVVIAIVVVVVLLGSLSSGTGAPHFQNAAEEYEYRLQESMNNMNRASVGAPLIWRTSPANQQDAATRADLENLSAYNRHLKEQMDAINRAYAPR